MAAELVALLGDREAGWVRRDRRGRLSFITARQALLHAGETGRQLGCPAPSKP